MDDTNFQDKTKNNFYLILVSILIFFSAFRDMIGGYDIYIYGAYYEGIEKFGNRHLNFEKGFYLFNLGLSYISENREFLFASVAIIILSVQSFVIKKWTPFYLTASFFIFCKLYLMYFVYLRQSLAMVIAWLSLYFVFKRQFIPFLVIIFIAYNFHSTALIFLPVYFMHNLRLNKNSVLVIIFIAALIGMTALPAIVGEYFASALELDKLTAQARVTSGINYFYIIESILLLIPIFLFLENSNPGLKLFGNLALLYCCFTLLSLTQGVFIRFGWYYLIGVAILLSYLPHVTKNSLYKLFFNYGMVLYFSLIFFRTVFLWDGGDFIPYKTIFSEGDRSTRWENREYRR